jgi:hypothetical protein
MILYLNESLSQAMQRRAQRESDCADLEERRHDSRALVHYQILVAQLKEVLARG